MGTGRGIEGVCVCVCSSVAFRVVCGSALPISVRLIVVTAGLVCVSAARIVLSTEGFGRSAFSCPMCTQSDSLKNLLESINYIMSTHSPKKACR